MIVLGLNEGPSSAANKPRALWNQMKKRALMTIFAAVTIPTSHAAVVTQTPVDANNLTDWNTPSIWSNAAAPSGGNTYESGNRIYSPNNPVGTDTFAGQSLQLNSGANLQLRNLGGPGETITINLILNGGEMAPNGTGTTHLDGTINVLSDSSIKLFQSTPSNTRNVIINSTISGESGVTLLNRRGSDVDNAFTRIDNPNNTFAGTWLSEDARFFFKNAGAVGINASIQVSNDGYTRVEGDWVGNSLIAVTGAEVEVRDGHTWTLNSVDVNNSLVAAGTYTVAQLNAETGDNGIFTGTGTVIVVPEPTAALLGAFGLLGLLRRRR